MTTQTKRSLRYIKVPKAWRCNSRGCKLQHMFFLCLFGMMAWISYITVQDADLNAKYPHSEFVMYIAEGIVFFIACVAYKRKIFLLKKVKFTPTHICVKRKKISLKYIEKLEFLQCYTAQYGGVYAHLFRLSFDRKTPAGKTIYFTMKFKENILSNPSEYDFYEDFIDVIMDWSDKNKDI